MADDEKIIELFFQRSEEAIRELDIKYGKVCHKLAYNIINNRQDAEECVNDALYRRMERNSPDEAYRRNGFMTSLSMPISIETVSIIEVTIKQ